MPQLTPWEVYQWATQCPAWKDKLPLMTAIAMAESGGNTDSENSCCVGLWQVNVLAHTQYTRAQMKNPAQNVQAACAIFKSQGLGAWESFTNGAYKKHTVEVEKSLKNAGVGEKVTEVGPVPESVVKGAENAVKGIGSWTKELGAILGFVGSSSGWLRIGKVLLGAVFLIIAVDELAKASPVSGPNTGSIKKTVEGAATGAALAKTATKAAKGKQAKKASS